MVKNSKFFAHPVETPWPILTVLHQNVRRSVPYILDYVELYLYPTVGTVLIHSVKPELTE